MSKLADNANKKVKYKRADYIKLIDFYKYKLGLLIGDIDEQN
jgi:hypothetical protein